MKYIIASFLCLMLLNGCISNSEYYFKGKVTLDGIPKSEVLLEYEFFSSSTQFTENSSKKTSILFTDENGKYSILKPNLKIDSIRLMVGTLAYENTEIISNSSEWNKSGIFSFKNTINLPTFKLIEIDKEKYCKIGLYKAEQEFKDQKYTHFENITVSQPNEKWWKIFKSELNILGIKLVVGPASSLDGKKEFVSNCRVKRMKELLKIKFGESWVEDLKMKINQEFGDEI